MNEAYVRNLTMLWDAGAVDWLGYFGPHNCLTWLDHLSQSYHLLATCLEPRKVLVLIIKCDVENSLP